MATAIQASSPQQAGSSLLDRYRAVRSHTEGLCRTLHTEDYVVSSMPDVSPTKWHLAHTSWFFETFVLAQFDAKYVSPNPRYAFLFNSYYVQAGERHCRAQRGLVTRPTVAEVFEYRAHVDEHMNTLLSKRSDPRLDELVELGLHHEQQHQELLLTDIKHVFWTNPLRPALWPDWKPQPVAGRENAYVEIPEGLREIGHDATSFAFDNESPRHRVYVDAFRLRERLVSNADFLAFIDDGGYRRPELWLAAGWALVKEQHREHPFYWERTPDGWMEFTFGGMQPLHGSAAVGHVTYYEADAFARWSGARLPTEPEWEVAAAEGSLPDAFGSRWQWTNTAYTAYPGYQPAKGAIGEYNGKWMADQWVLRGSSVATPPGHERITYRNFFPSDTRWQFTGIRLAA